MTNILNGIEASKQVPFDRVLYALGIRYVGQTVAKKLATHYRDIELLKRVTVEELILVDEIGEKIAGSVMEFFGKEKNLNIIERLKMKGVQFEMSKSPEPLSDKLQGKTIVASGRLEHFSRGEIEETIRQHGGKPASSVSKKTDYLLAGENVGPNKLEKAKELNVRIINEEEFRKMIERE